MSAAKRAAQRRASIKNGTRAAQGPSSSSSNSSSSLSPYDRAKALGYGGGSAPVGESVAQTYNRGVDVLNKDPAGIRGGMEALKRAGDPGGPIADNRIFNPAPQAVEQIANNIPDTPRNPGIAAGNTGFNAGGFNTTTSAPGTSRSDQFYKSLLDSLKPSNEENQVADQQAALESELRNTNQGQDEMNRNIKDQPIALPFITGQQSAVGERYTLARNDIGNRQQTLQAKLANLQARRQAAMDVSKTGLDYAQKQEDRDYQKSQDTIKNNMALSNQYAGILQQQYENRTAEQKYKDAQAGKTTGSNKVTNSNYNPAGNIDFINAPKKTVLNTVSSTFAPATATKVQTQLTDEQLRLFMNDYTTTQNESQQSIMPEWYLEQWKAAAGIGGGSSSSGGGRSV